MADTTTTTETAEAEGFSVTLTKDNYPQSLAEQDRVETIEGCMQIATFLKVAVASMLVAEREEGLPIDTEGDRIMLGYERCCDLLMDKLDTLTGDSQMPFINDVNRSGAE